MGGTFAAPLKKLLLDAGCRFERQVKGDHDFWHSPITKLRFVVDGKILPHHTAGSVLKPAGLAKAFRFFYRALDSLLVRHRNQPIRHFFPAPNQTKMSQTLPNLK